MFGLSFADHLKCTDIFIFNDRNRENVSVFRTTISSRCARAIYGIQKNKTKLDPLWWITLRCGYTKPQVPYRWSTWNNLCSINFWNNNYLHIRRFWTFQKWKTKLLYEFLWHLNHEHPTLMYRLGLKPLLKKESLLCVSDIYGTPINQNWRGLKGKGRNRGNRLSCSKKLTDTRAPDHVESQMLSVDLASTVVWQSSSQSNRITWTNNARSPKSQHSMKGGGGSSTVLCLQKTLFSLHISF